MRTILDLQAKEKRFGFILPDAGGIHIFAHINDYTQRHKPPVKGQENKQERKKARTAESKQKARESKDSH